MNAPTHKWTYASAFLYSLTLITTIGEWASLVEPSFPPPLLLPLHFSGRKGEGRRLGQFISTRADVLRLPTAESCACVGAFETLTERLSAQLTGWLDDWMTSWPPPDRLLLLINKLSTWGGHGQRALGYGRDSSMPAAASSYGCCYFFLLLLLSFIFCCQHSLHTWQHFSIYEAARWFCNSSPQLTAETWLQGHTAQPETQTERMSEWERERQRVSRPARSCATSVLDSLSLSLTLCRLQLPPWFLKATQRFQ